MMPAALISQQIKWYHQKWRGESVRQGDDREKTQQKAVCYSNNPQKEGEKKIKGDSIW